MAAHENAVRIVPRAMSTAAWELYDDNFSESSLHRDNVDLLRDVLREWNRTGEHHVVCNLAIRWNRENPKVAVDPEVCLLSGATPGLGRLRDLRTWMPGHATPSLAIEIFNSENDLKDYTLLPEKYAASGIRELVIFDAELGAPEVHGGRHRLQLWERMDDGTFARTYAGEGPARSTVLDAWLVVTGKPALKMLQVAADEAAERSGARSSRGCEPTRPSSRDCSRALPSSRRSSRSGVADESDGTDRELARRHHRRDREVGGVDGRLHGPRAPDAGRGFGDRAIRGVRA